MRTFDPFQEANTLYREIDRLFGGRGIYQNFSKFLNPTTSQPYPALNVRETADDINVKVLAPGIDPEKLEISVHQNKLTISGERSSVQDSESDTYHRRERTAGKFSRTITLPSDVDENKVEAKYTAGIINLVLPKAESAKPRKIEVAVA